MAGHERNDVHTGYLCFPEGSHIIFYLVSGEFVDIIGSLYKSIDIAPGVF